MVFRKGSRPGRYPWSVQEAVSYFPRSNEKSRFPLASIFAAETSTSELRSAVVFLKDEALFECFVLEGWRVFPEVLLVNRSDRQTSELAKTSEE
jgi:hypothetical protein